MNVRWYHEDEVKAMMRDYDDLDRQNAHWAALVGDVIRDVGRGLVGPNEIMSTIDRLSGPNDPKFARMS